MKKDVILAGVGGQGLLSIAAVIAQAAHALGLNLKQAEVHGWHSAGGRAVPRPHLGSTAPLRPHLGREGRSYPRHRADGSAALPFFPFS